MEKNGIPTEELINLYKKFGEGGYGIIVTGCIMINRVRYSFIIFIILFFQNLNFKTLGLPKQNSVCVPKYCPKLIEFNEKDKKSNFASFSRLFSSPFPPFDLAFVLFRFKADVWLKRMKNEVKEKLIFFCSFEKKMNSKVWLNNNAKIFVVVCSSSFLLFLLSFFLRFYVYNSPINSYFVLLLL